MQGGTVARARSRASRNPRSTAYDMAQQMANQPDALEEAAASGHAYYQDHEANATNGFSAVTWHFGGLFNDAGYGLAETARAGYRLVTDPATQINAVKGLGYAVTHPGEVADSAIDGIKSFAAKPFGEEADSVFKFALGSAATMGAGKGLGVATDLAYQGAGKAAEALGPTADAMMYKSMQRSGLVMNLVEDSGVPGNTIVDAEANALQRIAANNKADTGSAARMARIDELSTANYNRILTQDLAGTDYVYRSIPEKMVDVYRAQMGISGRGGSSAYFSLEGGATPLEQKLGVQMIDEPQVLLKIPTSELINPQVPRPFGYELSPSTFGREYFANSYPKYGPGGFRQFTATTNSFSDSWIVSPWGK